MCCPKHVFLLADSILCQKQHHHTLKVRENSRGRGSQRERSIERFRNRSLLRRQDGASSQDGVSQDGASQDGASQDGAEGEGGGAARDGTCSPAGSRSRGRGGAPAQTPAQGAAHPMAPAPSSKLAAFMHKVPATGGSTSPISPGGTSPGGSLSSSLSSSQEAQSPPPSPPKLLAPRGVQPAATEQLGLVESAPARAAAAPEEKVVAVAVTFQAAASAREFGADSQEDLATAAASALGVSRSLASVLPPVHQISSRAPFFSFSGLCCCVCISASFRSFCGGGGQTDSSSRRFFF